MLEDLLKTYRKYKSPIIQQNQSYNIIDYDNDTELILNKISSNRSSSFIVNQKKTKEKKKKGGNGNESTPIHIPEKHKHKHVHNDCSTCFECHPYFRMLKKEKKKLVNYINNNTLRNIKLIGNYRYSNTSPKKYVNDTNKKLSSRKMGIIPRPLNKKKKNLSALEYNDYHDLQRSIVMMR